MLIVCRAVLFAACFGHFGLFKVTVVWVRVVPVGELCPAAPMFPVKGSARPVRGAAGLFSQEKPRAVAGCYWRACRRIPGRQLGGLPAPWSGAVDPPSSPVVPRLPPGVRPLLGGPPPPGVNPVEKARRIGDARPAARGYYRTRTARAPASRQCSTTSDLTATAFVYTLGAGITAGANTRLVLQLLLAHGFKLCSFRLPVPVKEYAASIFVVTTSPFRQGVIYAPAALLGSGSRFSGSISGIEP